MILNQRDFERYIRATAKRANLHVEWSEDPTPVTDGKKIRLPKLNVNATEMDYRKLLHYAVHEGDHILYSSFELPKKKNIHVGNSFLGAIWNAVEDYRIERIGTREFEGDRQNADYVYQEMWKVPENGIRTNRMATEPERNALAEKIGPLFVFLNDMNKDMYPAAHHVDPKLEAELTPSMKEKVAKLRAGDYADVLRNAADIVDREAGTEATYQVARRIFEEVYGEDAKKEEEEKQQQKQQAEGEGEGEGQPEDGEEGEGDGEDSGDNPKQGKQSKLPEVKYTEWMPGVHDDPKGRPFGHHVVYSDEMWSGPATPATDEEYSIVDFRRDIWPSELRIPRGTDHYAGTVRSMMKSSSDGFASRVRMKLQIRSRDRYEYGTKRGRIHTPSLYRAILKDSPGLNERVFKKRIINNTLDTCVSVLVDTSGSMGGEKYQHAMISAALLNEAIGNVIGLPLEVIGFSETHRSTLSIGSPLMFIHRDFSVPRLQTDELIRRMGVAGNFMTGNPDGDAVLFAYDRIKQRREKRKVLIVLSDGSPACSRPGDQMRYAKQVVGNIQKEKRVEILGIGIMDRNVQMIYQEHYVIQDAAELEHALLSIIDRKVR